MSVDSESEAFARLIAAIEPWLGEIVIIGGWAHRLYRLHPSAQALDYVPSLTTLDADVATPLDFPVESRMSASAYSRLAFPRNFSGTTSRSPHITNSQNPGEASLPNF